MWPDNKLIAEDLTERDCADQSNRYAEFIHNDDCKKFEFYVIGKGTSEQFTVNGEVKEFSDSTAIITRVKGEPDEVEHYSSGDMAPGILFRQLSKSRKYTRYGARSI